MQSIKTHSYLKYQNTGISRCLALGLAATLASGKLTGLQAEITAADQQVAVAPQQLSEAFRRAVEIVQPAVVSISTQTKIPPRGGFRGGAPGGLPDELRRFFGDDMGRLFRRPAPDGGTPKGRPGFGSGVIVSKDGYILTNNHVVADADEITVELYDESSYEAEVVGRDPKTDIAVIKIKADGDLPSARLADSDLVRICDWVVALGGPFGLRNTVTAGIVSAKERNTVGIADYESFIQTDTAINPGNSGGPLINMDGEVVGINTAIATRSGQSAGVGFAIPSNMAQLIMGQLIDTGEVRRGLLGAMVQDLTPELAESFGFDGKDGVLLGDVIEDGPADKAKLESGDVVTKMDGKEMASARQLRNTVAETPPGTEVEIEFYRDGRARTVKVKLGRLEGGPDDAVGRTDEEEQGADAAAGELGFEVRTLSPELAAQLELDENQEGVVVINVEPGGEAQSAGLRRGDVILSVGGKRVADERALDEQLREQDLEKGVRLQVLSGAYKRFVFLKRG